MLPAINLVARKGNSGASFRAVRGELVIVAMQSVVCTGLLHRTTRPILLHKVTVLRDVYFGLPRRFAVAAPVCFELRETSAARPSANAVGPNPSGLSTWAQDFTAPRRPPRGISTRVHLFASFWIRSKVITPSSPSLSPISGNTKPVWVGHIP